MENKDDYGKVMKISQIKDFSKTVGNLLFSCHAMP